MSPIILKADNMTPTKRAPRTTKHSIRYGWMVKLSLFLSLLIASGTALAADEASPKKTKNAPAQKPVPKHDAPDQPFRYAPLAVATRSVVVPLSANVHLAFDGERLRTHTVWTGSSLNLFGPPYHGSSDRFTCDFDGTTLWKTPQICPWFVSDKGAKWTSLAKGSQFRGVSTHDLNGHVVLMYELGLENGEKVRVHETPFTRTIEGNVTLERRLEIGPCKSDLIFLAQAEHGTFADTRPDITSLIRRTNDNLVIRLWDVGVKGVSLLCTNETVKYTEILHVEKDGKGPQLDRKTNSITETEARVYVRIPAHKDEVAIQIATVVASTNANLPVIELVLGNGTMVTPNLSSATNKTTAPASTPKTFAAEKTFVPRLDGDKSYKVEHFPLPKEIDLRVTGMDFLPNGDLVVSSWAGEVYIVHNAQSDVRNAAYQRFARGLMEPMGLKVWNGQIYLVQKGELTRLVDSDGNGEADIYETLNSNWGFTGRYNAFAFGPEIDKQGNFYIFTCGNGGIWDVPYMGWALRTTVDRTDVEPFASGLRVPNGYAAYGDGNDIFVTENQGNWIGACKLNHLQRGKFYGFPSTSPAPKEQFEQPTKFTPPAVWFPYTLAKSASGIAVLNDEKLGPFKGQMLVADYQLSVVTRVMLEKVNGEYQGAVWPFAKGFLSGINRLAVGPDGKVYVGGGKGAHWSGAVGPQMYSLDRLAFTGKAPFEVKEVHAAADGFDLLFTEPVDPEAAGKPESYDVAQYTYEYHKAYGSPEFDHAGNPNSSTDIKIASAKVSDDKLKVHLTLEGLRKGYVTMVRSLDVVSDAGDNLRHDTFWYTLNEIPNK